MSGTTIGGSTGGGGDTGGWFSPIITDLPGGSFSRLLLSEDVVFGEATTNYVATAAYPAHHYDPNRAVGSEAAGFGGGGPCNVSSPTSASPSDVAATLFSADTPKMLCFGNDRRSGSRGGGGMMPTPISMPMQMDSCSEISYSGALSPIPKNSRRKGKGVATTSVPKGGSRTPNNRTNRALEIKQEVEQKISVPATVEGERVAGKKRATGNGRNGSAAGSSSGRAKKRVKLVDHVAALQRLVCPYGKSDTASVLDETTGYIRFLHDQVRVLCNPYLKRRPSPSTPASYGDGDIEDENGARGLKSKGLCLVPVDCLSHIATNNSFAEFWSSASSVPNST